VIGILLIDDHASTREPLAFMLNQEPDLTVIAQAGSLAEARQALATVGGDVDVAVIDLGLPDGSGEEIIADLRRESPQAVALVLTYFSERERLAQAVEAGALGILHKSTSVEDVLTAVRRLHAGEQLVTTREVVESLQLLHEGRRRDQEAQRSFERLTHRETEVLHALAKGMSDREISDQFNVAPATVRTHITNILAKLDASSRLEALVLAVRCGITTID
jgi:DNA-binding NarL/FixJ family response regulator